MKDAGAGPSQTYDPAADSRATATAEKETPLAESPAAAPKPPRCLCEGLPVQYHTGQQLVGATLVRPCRTTDGWDLKIIVPGASVSSSRSNVRFAKTPTAGCFNLLPGLKYVQ